MENTWMYLYKQDSEAGNALARALEVPIIRHRNSRFRGAGDRTVINWGAGELPTNLGGCRIINNAEAVARSINKLEFFRATYNSCRTVPWTSCRWEAAKWLAEGHRVVCRTRLEGREGAGISIAEPRKPVDGDLRPGWGVLAWLLNARPEPTSAFPEACRLFTKFIPSQREYRVHVVGGRVIAVHRKVEGRDESIRNTANGWLFRRVNDYPAGLSREALAVVATLGLDFAAVDILWDGVHCWTLETNTAPGIDGMTWTLARYREAFERLVQQEG